MIKSITNLITCIFFLFQQLQPQISQIDKMDITRFAMKLLIYWYTYFERNLIVYQA